MFGISHKYEIPEQILRMTHDKFPQADIGLAGFHFLTISSEIFFFSISPLFITKWLSHKKRLSV